MLKKACLLILLNSCLTLPLWAQKDLVHQVSEAKFEIIKASVEFVASDDLTFGNGKKSPCQPCDTYEALNAFADKNKLAGVPVLIKRWRTVKLDTVTANGARRSLQRFAGQVRDTLTGGAKSKRKALRGFQAYQQHLMSIVGGIDTVVVTKPVGSVTTTTAPGLGSDQSDDTESWFSPFCIEVAEAVVSLLLLVFWLKKRSFYRNKLRLTKKASDKEKEGISTQLENAVFRIRSLESENIDLQKKNEQLEEETSQLKKVNVTGAIEPKTPDPATFLPVSEYVAPEPVQETKFARYADQGDGFSASELLTQENGETIFEIRILTLVSAEYQITQNIAAQKYALANANYFLSKACKYDSTPSGTILTDVPGELRLQGNKWQIIEPAKISFKPA